MSTASLMPLCRKCGITLGTSYVYCADGFMYHHMCYPVSPKEARILELERDLAAAGDLELEHSDTIRHLKTDRDRYAAALRIIAGIDHCIDGLMGNVDVARVALRVTNSEEKK